MIDGNTSQDATRQEKLERVLAEYLQSVESGQALNRAELINANPDLATDLEEFFRNRDSMDRMAAPMKAAADVPTVVGWQDEGVATIGDKIRYFGDYELLQEIARGGMGVVYRARQVSLNRTVALKMILAGELASAEGISRFHREAEAAANLDHPNIIPIYEVGTHEGQHYFSMKLIEGMNLSQQMVTGGWPSVSRKEQRRSVELIVKVARAVHYAHQRGILHRDLKPGNILIETQGEPHVTDFGLAKKIDGNEDNTRTGCIIGTPSYMAPEQARVEKVMTTAVDVYGIGAILYELLTGRPPFRADTPLNTIRQVLEREPESPRRLNPDVDLDLSTICLKCLEKDRESRYDSAASLAMDLERWCDGETIQARPVGLFERSRKWVRRKPLQAAFLAVLVGSTTLIVTTMLIASWRVSAQQQMTVQATTARDEAVDVAKTIRYVQSAAVVERTIDFGEPYIADKRLAKMDPELRSWEWNMLHRRIRAELQFLVAPPLIEKRDGIETTRRFALKHVTLLPGQLNVAALRKDFNYSNDPGDLVIWNSQSGTMDRQHSGVNEPLAISPEGQLFASPQSDDGTVAIRDLESGRVLATLPKDESFVHTLAFSPDGRLLAISSSTQEKNSVVVWDVANRTRISRFADHCAPIAHLAFGPDGRQLATASQIAEELVVWDVKSGNEVIRFDRPGEIYQLAFSPRGDVLASTNNKFRLTVWDIKTGSVRNITARQDGQSVENASEIRWEGSEAGGIAFSPDGRLLASCTTSATEIGTNEFAGWNLGTVRLSDVDTGQQLLLLRGKIGMPVRLSFSPDGRSLAWSRRDPSVTVCDFERLRTEMTLHGGGQVAVSPDGGLVAYSDGRLSIYDTRHGRLVRPPMGNVNFSRPLGVAFSHDGTRVAGGMSAGAGGVPIWDLATGKIVVTLKSPDSAYNIAFSPDDRLVVIASSMSVCVCDAVTGIPVFDRTKQGKGKVYCGAFSSDGKRLATGGLKAAAHDDGEPPEIGDITIWDVATWLPIRHLDGLYSGATSVAWNPKGTLIAACAGVPSDDGSGRRNGNPHEVLVWDAETGEERLRLEGHASDVNAVMFTPDSHRLLTASADRTVKLWDVKLGLEVMTLHRATHPIVSLAASHDGRVLAAGGSLNVSPEDPRNQLWIWNASPLKPAPDDFRYPFWETSARWNVNDLVAELARPSAQFKAPHNEPSVLTADLSRYLVPNGNSGVTVYDTRTGNIQRILEGLNESVTAMAVSGDGRVAAIAHGPIQRATYNYDPKTSKTTPVLTGNDGPGEVQVSDLITGQVLCVFRGHAQPVNGVAVSPDGKTVASVSTKESVLHVWDAATGEIRASFKGGYRNLVFASDCQRFIAIRSKGPEGQPANETVIFDAETAQIIKTVPNPPAGTMQHWLRSDGNKIIRNGPKTTGLWTPSQPSQIQIVDVQTGKVEQEITEPHDFLLAAAFGPGPSQLTTVNGTQIVRVWDLTTSQPVRTYNHEQVWLPRATLSSDARRLGFLSYASRGVQIWDINRLSLLPD